MTYTDLNCALICLLFIMLIVVKCFENSQHFLITVSKKLTSASQMFRVLITEIFLRSLKMFVRQTSSCGNKAITFVLTETKCYLLPI